MFGGATICNLLQVRSASRLNNVFTLLKLTTALAFGGLVFFSPHTSIQNVFAIASPSGSTNIAANVAAVLPLAMGGFSGIEMSGCTASETADARKTVPRAIFSALITVSLVYVGMCIAVASTSPFALNVDKTMAVIPGTDVIATAPALGGYLGGPLVGFYSPPV